MFLFGSGIAFFLGGAEAEWEKSLGNFISGLIIEFVLSVDLVNISCGANFIFSTVIGRFATKIVKADISLLSINSALDGEGIWGIRLILFGSVIASFLGEADVKWH